MAACLLLFLEEEDAFWMMCAIIEDLLPASYFSTTLLGVQTDQRVLRQLIVQYLPRLDKLLQEHDIGEGQRPAHGAGHPQPGYGNGLAQAVARVATGSICLQSCR